MKILKGFLNFVLILVLLLVLGCKSTHTANQDGLYSLQHIDFSKWKRSEQCCTAAGKKIAIASGGELASQEGLHTFEKGGNVVDIAVTVAFCLAVERPHSAGLGGGGFMTLYFPGKRDKDHFVDFREMAPRLSRERMYLDASGNVIPKLSTEGGLAIGTPGFVAGLYEIHRKWGSLPWAKVLEPAAHIARKGFSVYPVLAEEIEESKEQLLKDPSTRKIFFREGRPMRAGETLVQEELANTIDTIAKDGKTDFYQGGLAKKIVSHVKQRGGILDAEDMKNYQVRFREPIHLKFSQYYMISAPPPSAGGVLTAQMLNVLDGFQLLPISTKASNYIHLLSEAMKYGYADRSKFIGDPDFVKIPVKALMTQEYATLIRQNLNIERATPGDKIVPGQYLKPESQETTHLSIMDDKGNAVASTITINGSFGAALMPPDTGIFLNNEMDDFSVKPGTKNLYGLTGGKANAISPLKRPVSSMMPTIILKDGLPVLAVGAAGGSKIISSVLQVILNHLFLYQDIHKAVFAPRMHHQWIPDTLELEPAFSAVTEEALKAKGHKLKRPDWQAQVQAVAWDVNTKTVVATFDPRSHGGAVAR